MTQSRLDQMERRAAVERVRGMAVAEPVGANIGVDTSSPGSGAHNAPNLRRREVSAFLPRAEDWGVRVAPLSA